MAEPAIDGLDPVIDRIVELPQLAGAHQPAVQVANLLLQFRLLLLEIGIELVQLSFGPLQLAGARLLLLVYTSGYAQGKGHF